MLLPLLLLPFPASAEPPPGLVERARPSVVTLITQDVLGRPLGNGTGFLISSDGLVVTNHHVVAAGPTVAVLADGSRRTVKGLLVSDEESDVAILRIAGDGYPALHLGAAVPPAVGDKVLVIGSPQGLEQTVTEGEISALRPTGLPPEAGDSEVARAPLVQINADIAPGSSGSPVLTTDGDVIGVAQSANTASDSYFAVDVSAVLALQARAPADGALTAIASPTRQLVMTLALVGGVLGLGIAPGAWRAARGRFVAWLARRRRARSSGPAPFRRP
jgi:putative serine protease PepD